MSKNVDEMYCVSCGAIIKKEATICVHCGVPNKLSSSCPTSLPPSSFDEKKLILLLLCLFLGCFGIHRFYSGKIGTGLLYMLTFGLFVVGIVIDLIRIINGTFDVGNK
ncbi:Hypothetical protein BCD_1429 (plasmid) [Borrelia crocidurae DOU]|uniref:TM2 domain-containing protein n=1 Tax=Borrelia crocidurae DOU TaxID=1293575 RepID=W5SKU1_9SPIR|nr:TM2 domain-containing protein [Borrelia crocidurae]AHH07495.1 Hypothetical protein BCD_1429 [Borrelia crocidurae DOU]